MRNLIYFIVKNHFFLLFILLEVLSFYLIANNKSYHRFQLIHSANKISGNIYIISNNILNYFHLKEVNDLLAAENARLRTFALQSFEPVSTNLIAINDSVYKQRYNYLTAKVVNNSTTHTYNYLTLNKGRKQGVEPNQAVLSSNGIVGITKHISDNFCTAISLLNANSKVSAKIKKNNQIGSLVWEVGNPYTALLLDVPLHVKLSIGDTVVTSGYSSIFPEGSLIGIIDSFEAKPGANFFKVRVRLSTDFNGVTFIYIVKDLSKEERLSLEKSNND